MFHLKLFGNIEFVGELNRRKLLPTATLVSAFDSLLGIGSYTIDDLVLEQARELLAAFPTKAASTAKAGSGSTAGDAPSAKRRKRD